MAGHNLLLGSTAASGDSDQEITAASADSDQEILNYDLLAKVFSYLSAKNLYSLQLVSKSVKNMITSDTLFHLMQSYHNAATTAIFVKTCCDLQFFLLDPDAGLPPVSLDVLTFYRDITIHCSAGGLIFWSNDSIGYSICAYNPVRCESCLIDMPLDYNGGIALNSSLAVEFVNNGDGVARDYKLVFLNPEWDWPNSYRCRVYDSAAEVWTRDEMIHYGERGLQFENPAVHRGTVFWASDCFFRDDPVDLYVMSYEIATGAVEFLAIPDGGDVKWGDNISVAVWEESWLCLVHYRRSSGTFTVWRWRADSHSWAKLNEFVYLEDAESVGSMLVCDGGKEKGMVLVFSVYNEACVYSFRQRDLTRLKTNTGLHFPTFTAYANTLRPARPRLQETDESIIHFGL